jgi:hypothetical protein
MTVPPVHAGDAIGGDSYDNALAETINGLYKAEVIHRRGPWRSFEAVEYATLEWVDWFNHRRLLGPIGNIPPAKAEDQYYAAADSSIWQRDSQPNASGRPGAVQTDTMRQTAKAFEQAPGSLERLAQSERIVAEADEPHAVVGLG